MTLHDHLMLCERVYLEHLLEKHGGNKSATAREAGLNRTALYKKLRRKGVRGVSFAPRNDGNSAWQAMQ